MEVVYKTVLFIGKQTVMLTSSNQEKLAAITALYHKANDHKNTHTVDKRAANTIIINLDEQPQDLNLIEGEIRQQALNAHTDYIWIDAATLVAPNGKSILLVGKGESGKTTLTTALAKVAHWKIVNEDIALIDPSTASILSIYTPLSLRTGTQERLSKYVGINNLSLHYGQWLVEPELFADESIQLPVSAAILLKGVNPEEPEPISLCETTASDFTVKLIPLSNILRLKDAINFVVHHLSKTPCFLLEGGNPKERMDAISNTLAMV